MWCTNTAIQKRIRVGATSEKYVFVEVFCWMCETCWNRRGRNVKCTSWYSFGILCELEKTLENALSNESAAKTYNIRLGFAILLRTKGNQIVLRSIQDVFNLPQFPALPNVYIWHSVPIKIRAIPVIVTINMKKDNIR